MNAKDLQQFYEALAILSQQYEIDLVTFQNSVKADQQEVSGLRVKLDEVEKKISRLNSPMKNTDINSEISLYSSTDYESMVAMACGYLWLPM